MRISDWSSDVCSSDLSLFFRDIKPFDLMRDVVLPPLLTARASTKRIRIWSAACSSGQEPYSLAMLFSEIGRASRRERVCQYVSFSVVAVLLNKKQQKTPDNSKRMC